MELINIIVYGDGPSGMRLEGGGHFPTYVSKVDIRKYEGLRELRANRIKSSLNIIKFEMNFIRHCKMDSCK